MRLYSVLAAMITLFIDSVNLRHDTAVTTVPGALWRQLLCHRPTHHHSLPSRHLPYQRSPPSLRRSRSRLIPIASHSSLSYIVPHLTRTDLHQKMHTSHSLLLGSVR